MLKYFLFLAAFFIDPFKGLEKEPCLGYDLFNNDCLDCGYDSYKKNIGLNANRVNLSECNKKKDENFSKTIFITNIPCKNGAECDGTSDYPYDNLIKAFIQEGQNANSFKFSFLNFKILGSPHFVLRKHFEGSSVQLFRRLNASIKIAPGYCDEILIKGCLAQGEKIVIYLKADMFTFYAANEIEISHIIFNGTDLHYLDSFSSNLNNSCYNQETICCTPSNLNKSYSSSTNRCGLLRRSLTKANIYGWNVYAGFFNLEALIDDPQLIVPRIVVQECIFYHLYNVKPNQGWLAIFYINDLYPGNLIIINTIFNDIRFTMGLVFQENMELFAEDWNYSLKYNLCSRSVELSNSSVENYNKYMVRDLSYSLYETGLFKFTSYKGTLKLTSGSVKNIKHNTRLVTIFIYCLSGSFSIMNVIFSNISSVLLIYSSDCSIKIDKSVFVSYQFYVDFMYYANENSVTIQSLHRSLNPD